MTKIENKRFDELCQFYNPPPESKFTGGITYSTLFILPATGLGLNDRLISRYYVNCFIDDMGTENNCNNPIYVLFEVSVFDTTWKILENTLRNKEHYKYDYDCGMKDEKHLVMFVFECPALFIEDYQKFLAGEYSKFSEFYKRFFPRKMLSNTKQLTEHPAWGVINKSKEIKEKVESIIDQKLTKDQEYFSIYEPSREIYRYNKN